MSAQPRPLSIAFAPMSLADALLLRAGLRAGGLRWQEASSEGCDVVLATDLATLPKPPAESAVVRIVAGPRRVAPSDVRFLDRWPSTAQLTDTITSARRSPANAATTAGTAAPLHGAPLSVEGWLALVSSASAGMQQLHLSGPAGPVAWIDPAAPAGWVAPGVANALPAAMGDASLAVLIAPAGTIPSEALRCSSAHVLWAIALGRTWTAEAIGVDRHRCLRLRRWPDFGSLERRDTFLRVASQLISAPTSLDQLLAAHPARQADVLALVAGCRLCGWLDITDIYDRDAPTRPGTPARGTLSNAMGRLRRALGIGNA